MTHRPERRHTEARHARPATWGCPSPVPEGGTGRDAITGVCARQGPDIGNIGANWPVPDFVVS